MSNNNRLRSASQKNQLGNIVTVSSNTSSCGDDANSSDDDVALFNVNNLYSTAKSTVAPKESKKGLGARLKVKSKKREEIDARIERRIGNLRGNALASYNEDVLYKQHRDKCLKEMEKMLRRKYNRKLAKKKSLIKTMFFNNE